MQLDHENVNSNAKEETLCSISDDATSNIIPKVPLWMLKIPFSDPRMLKQLPTSV